MKESSILKGTLSILTAVVIAWLTSVYVDDNRKVVALFRELAINELAVTDNLNNLRIFESSTSTDLLPQPLLEIDLDPVLATTLLPKLGSAQFHFLKTNIVELNYLNNSIGALRDAALSGKVNSDEYLSIKSEYIRAIKRLDGNNPETRTSPFKDNGCILFMLKQVYRSWLPPFRLTDARYETPLCDSETLRRIQYYYGYYPSDTPEWLRKEFKSKLPPEAAQYIQ